MREEAEGTGRDLACHSNKMVLSEAVEALKGFLARVGNTRICILGCSLWQQDGK